MATLLSGRHERYAVLGLASPRSPWFAEVSRWATASVLPLEFVKCVSADEVHAHLRSGRPFSAVLADASVAGVDRELLAAASGAGCAVLVVDDGRVPRDWTGLGAASVLLPGFGPDVLRLALTQHARSLSRIDAEVRVPVEHRPEAGWRGRLVAVCGHPGAGVSTIAMAAAQGLATDPRLRQAVLLADLVRHAELAMLHDAADQRVGLLELVDAHRLGAPALDALAPFVLDVVDRGYHLLTGLRRHREWTALRPRLFDAALDSLRRGYRVVVADCDDDLEGELETGSVDIEERNHPARRAAGDADLVLAVGGCTTTGLHRLARTVDALVGLGVEPARIVPVLNRAPRSPRERAQVVRAAAELLAGPSGRDDLGDPVVVGDAKRLEHHVRAASPLPDSVVAPVATTVAGVLQRIPDAGRDAPAVPVPVAVVPGSLGRWSHEEVAS